MKNLRSVLDDVNWHVIAAKLLTSGSAKETVVVLAEPMVAREAINDVLVGVGPELEVERSVNKIDVGFHGECLVFWWIRNWG
jgi:hypothetical protein